MYAALPILIWSVKVDMEILKIVEGDHFTQITFLGGLTWGIRRLKRAIYTESSYSMKLLLSFILLLEDKAVYTSSHISE